MRQVRIHEQGGPEVLRVEDLPTPEPGPGEALVEVAATGVNFVEIYQRMGVYRVRLPFALGAEGAGTVRAVGTGVTDLAAGDRVAYAAGVSGSYATDLIAPAHRLVKVPAGVDLKDAAAVMLQGLTAHYLANDVYPLKAGDTCLIHAAAGGVGALLCQIARAKGARVIATVGSDTKAAIAREAGAHETIVYTKQDFAAEVKRLTEGRGVQVAYDSVGKDTWEGSLASLARRGMLALFGQSSGLVPPIDPLRLQAAGSAFMTRPTLGDYCVGPELQKRANDVLGAVAGGSLKVRIAKSYALADAAQAHRDLASRDYAGKLVLLPA